MANCAFGWPIYSDNSVSYTPAFSAGSWSASLPLTNLKDRRLAKVARSSDALAASTTFDVDLGVARDVGVLSILIPNLTKTTTPTIRWYASTTSNFALTPYDSGALQAWPSSFTAEDADGLNVWRTVIPSSVQSFRYWRMAIVDTGNADGYVDVARVVIAGKYQPTVNFAVGAAMDLETATQRTLSDGEAAFYDEKTNRRTFAFNLNTIPTETEAMTQAWKLKRQVGLSKQFFFVYDTADTYMHERAFLCVMRQTGPLTDAYSLYKNCSFQVIEEK